eukprot:scaffold5155_cov132-Skeletonema_marinoi.AAC.11
MSASCQRFDTFVNFQPKCTPASSFNHTSQVSRRACCWPDIDLWPRFIAGCRRQPPQKPIAGISLQ